jgi:hypothetical protein
VFSTKKWYVALVKTPLLEYFSPRDVMPGAEYFANDGPAGEPEAEPPAPADPVDVPELPVPGFTQRFDEQTRPVSQVPSA